MILISSGHQAVGGGARRITIAPFRLSSVYSALKWNSFQDLTSHFSGEYEIHKFRLVLTAQDLGKQAESPSLVL